MKSLLQFSLWLIMAWISQAFARADTEAGLRSIERQDYAQALKEFRAAAERGDADAQVNVGNVYLKGLGVERDEWEAFRWYLKAAGENHPMAQSKLGLMHFLGLGVERDSAAAAGWFRKAAEQGEPGAQSILASLYAQGEGLPRDVGEAYFWYTLAYQQGDADAGVSRDTLVDEMNPGLIAEALQRAEDWKRSKGIREPAALPDLSGEESARPAEIPSKRKQSKARRKRTPG